MKRTTIIAGLAAAAVVALGIAAYASPYRAVHALREAAESGDRDRLLSLVDFPALRESLKAELNATVIAPMLDKARDKPFAGLGTVLAGALLGPMVDAMVTPEGVAEMVRRGRPRPLPMPSNAATPDVPPAASAGSEAPPAPGPSAQPPGSASTARTATTARPQPTMGYAGLDRFVVTFPVPGGRNESAFDLIFLRHGFFGWKLSQVRFPPSSH